MWLIHFQRASCCGTLSFITQAHAAAVHASLILSVSWIPSLSSSYTSIMSVCESDSWKGLISLAGLSPYFLSVFWLDKLDKPRPKLTLHETPSHPIPFSCRQSMEQQRGPSPSQISLLMQHWMCDGVPLTTPHHPWSLRASYIRLSFSLHRIEVKQQSWTFSCTIDICIAYKCGIGMHTFIAAIVGKCNTKWPF